MYASFGEMRAANKSAGQFWFEPSTLAFFDSEMLTPIHRIERGAYFVSSEQAPASGTPGRADYYRPARRFSVRFIDAEGKVCTVGKFQQYDSPREAHTVAAAYALTGKTPGELLPGFDGTGL